MHWRWKQSTGELFKVGAPVMTAFARGYAGTGAGRNNPDLQCTSDIGPIPRGWYTLEPAIDHPAAVSIPLTPDDDNDMCRRAGFLIHADNVRFPGWASDGCIVIGEKNKRVSIRDSGIRRLEVVA